MRIYFCIHLTYACLHAPYIYIYECTLHMHVSICYTYACMYTPNICMFICISVYLYALFHLHESFPPHLSFKYCSKPTGILKTFYFFFPFLSIFLQLFHFDERFSFVLWITISCAPQEKLYSVEIIWILRKTLSCIMLLIRLTSYFFHSFFFCFPRGTSITRAPPTHTCTYLYTHTDTNTLHVCRHK